MAFTKFEAWYDAHLWVRCLPLLGILAAIILSIVLSRDRKAAASRMKQYLLSGVSYAIPFVACGGILIATSLAFAHFVPGKGPDLTGKPWLQMMLNIGSSSFGLLVPVLAGYIAFGMADRPGLVPGFVGGAIANEMKAGFLGGIVAGLVAGWIVQRIKKIRVPAYVRPVMPILVIPVLSSLVVGFVMYKVVGVPVKEIMDGLTDWLGGIDQGHKVALGVILGGMIAFDMGGPVNKAAFFFGTAMISKGNPMIMGACAAAIGIPPMGMGLATIIGRRLWTEQEREAGLAALAMGTIGITEGAIPFAAADPLRVIPTIMIGSMVGSVIAMLGGVGDMAPHGGLIVLPVITGGKKFVYIFAVAAGLLTVAAIINLLRYISYKRNPAGE